MKRGRRRLAAFLLALCMALSLTPQALAEEATQPAGDAQALGEPVEAPGEPVEDAQALGEPVEDAQSAETAPESAEDNAGEAETAVEVTFQVKATDAKEGAEATAETPDAEEGAEASEETPDAEEGAETPETPDAEEGAETPEDAPDAEEDAEAPEDAPDAEKEPGAEEFATLMASNVSYLDASGATKTASATPVTSSNSANYWGTQGSSSWYFVDTDWGSYTISSAIYAEGDVHLILPDGKTLNALNGIYVRGGHTLTIYGQSAGSGRLNATGASNYAGIGGQYENTVGTIIINGGIVTANGGTGGAGIGGGYGSNGGNITINGGTVTANGGTGGAGIGGGYKGTVGTIAINGGTVTATVPSGTGGAAIGKGGDSTTNASVTINSGLTVRAGTSGTDAKSVTDVANNTNYKYAYIGIDVASVKLNQSSLSLTAGGSAATLTATVEPSNASDKTVKWSVSGSGVKLYSDAACTTEVGADATSALTVYAKGVSGGNATVTVTSNADSAKKATCSVSVSVPVTGVTLDQTSLSLTAGGNAATLTATVAPENATDKKVKWSVNNSTVTLYSDSACTTAVGAGATSALTVYAKGVSDGNATVTVTSNDDNTKSASCTVTIHAHNFGATYQLTQTNAPNDTIKATCSASGCNLTGGKASLTIRAPASEAGGAAVLEGDTDAFGVSASSVKYYQKSGSNWTEITGTPSGGGFFKGSLTIASLTIEAAYGVNAITVASGIQNGSIESPPVATVGAVVPLTITPAQAWYELDTLTVTKTTGGGAVDVVAVDGGGKSFVMPDEAVTVSATFKLIDYAITLPDDDTVTAAVGEQAAATAHYNETVTLTVTPPEAWQELDTLTVAKTDGGDEIAVTTDESGGKSFAMPAGAVTVSVKFKPVDYAIAFNLPDSGSVTAAVEGTNATSANYNDTVTLAVAPAIGYELDTLTVEKTDGGDEIDVTTDESGGKSFVMPAGAVTVSATFKLSDYAITLPDDDSVTAAVGEQAAATARYGDTVTLSVTPPEFNYGVSGIEFRDASSDEVLNDIALRETSKNEYEFSMPARGVKITAAFAELETYAIFFQQDASASGAARLRLITGSTTSEHDITDESRVGNVTCLSYTLRTARTPDSVSFKIGDGDWTAGSDFAVTTDWVSVTGGRYQIVRGAGTIVVFLENSDNLILLGFDGTNLSPNADGSSGVSCRIVTTGSSITKPSDPTREGYDFVRWETDGSGEDAFKNGSITVNVNTILSAVWEQKTFSVSIDPDNGSAPSTSTVSYQGTAPKTSNPTKSGYAFVRWTVSRSVNENGLFFGKGSAFDFNTPITADLSLKAEWKHVHDYRSYPVTLFPSLSDYHSQASSLHLTLCMDDDCDEIYLEAHAFDASGKCVCGYQKPAEECSLSIAIDDKAPSLTKVKRGNAISVIAPASVNGKVFNKWQYSSDNANWQDLSVNRGLGLAVTFNIYLKAVYAERTPEVSISASQYNDNGGLLFSLNYAIPSGAILLDAGILGGNNTQIRFMEVHQMGAPNTFPLEPTQYAISAGIDELLSAMGKKEQTQTYYYSRADNVLDTINRNTLKTKMLNTLAINIPGYSDPYVSHTKVFSNCGNVYMLINVPNKPNYWDKLFFYGIGYAIYQENGETKMIATDPIAVTYNEPEHHEGAKT